MLAHICILFASCWVPPRPIEPHRLDALILEDLRLYPASSIKEIQQRIAPELPQGKIKRRIEQLIQQDQVQPLGENRWRRYRLRP